jgi:Sulfotransferase family
MPQTTPEPLIRFVIGGVQKGGTSALSRYLGAHPQLRLPRGKEAHLFDAPDFDDAWSTAEIDARYARAFDAADTSTLHGDATPFYVFHPRVVARIAGL